MSLDAVAVGIDDEGCVVVGTVVGTQAGSAVVAAARGERRGMERSDAVAGRGAEAEVQAGVVVRRHGPLNCADPEGDPVLPVAERPNVIALIACFASSWTPAMVRRWHADPFGFLRPWNEVPALLGSAPPSTPPSTGTGVVTFLMG